MKASRYPPTDVFGNVRSSTRETYLEMKGMADLEDRRLLFKVFSVLLQYPDEALVHSVHSLRGALALFSHDTSEAGCRGFLQYLEATPLISLQEDYVQTFDLRPSACLNLTFHECGDSKIRGAALADLSQLYKSAGYESSTGELPDFLPLMLEFLSICSSDTALRILERYQKQIHGLARQLHVEGSPYGSLLEALSRFIHEFKGAGD